MSRVDLGGIRWRLLIANLAVAGAGVIVVAAAVWLAAPAAFERAMGVSDGGMMGGGGSGGMMDPLLRAAFGDAVGSALLVGLGAAIAVAVVMAVLLATSLARPITALAAASRRVTHGDYAQRVPEAGGGEIGELARSFNDMAAALETNERRRLDLVGDVAHELRTPIASLRGYVEGLEAGVLEPGPDAWRVLDEQTARLGRLVDDLAILWRAESHDLRLQIERLDGPTLMADARERHRALAAERSIELTVGQADPVAMLADRTRLGQVLDDLIANALRYTPEGGHVAIGLAAAGTSAIISVRDDGPGLAPGAAERIFERFYRADPSRSREAGGSGLGLAISRSLVEAMGGTISAASEGPGQGTIFMVRLPRA
jgi:two-component system sensor histidine kinase BaeS